MLIRKDYLIVIMGFAEGTFSVVPTIFHKIFAFMGFDSMMIIVTSFATYHIISQWNRILWYLDQNVLKIIFLYKMC